MKQAIYPGSFDPITYGHLDIIKRARSIFDTVIITIFPNSHKKSLFSIDQRTQMIQTIFKDDPGVQVESHSGLLVEYAAQKNIFTLVRGLRALSDFDYEFQMALTNRKLDKRIETCFLMTDEHLSYISSSTVKEISRLGGNVSAFVPDIVQDALKEQK